MKNSFVNFGKWESNNEIDLIGFQANKMYPPIKELKEIKKPILKIGFGSNVPKDKDYAIPVEDHHNRKQKEKKSRTQMGHRTTVPLKGKQQSFIERLCETKK
jgi:hypothetical protein